MSIAMQDRVLSVHVPKAGGTSLLRQFRNLLGDALATDYAHPPLGGSDRDSATFPPGVRVLHGHFNPRRYAAEPARWVTFLRDPVENLLSIWAFWRSLPATTSPLHQRFAAESPSPEAFARYPGVQALLCRTYFGGVDMGRFEFVGFHETRSVDIPRLGAWLGLPLLAEVHENRTPAIAGREEMLADAALRGRLRDILAEDVRFYERLRG
jgi:hypothetical protein